MLLVKLQIDEDLDVYKRQTQGFASHFQERTLPGVYVCRGTTCFPPTSDLAELRSALWSRVN